MSSDQLTANPRKAHLKGMDPDEAIAAGEAAQSLTSHPGWAALVDSIDRYQRHEQRMLMLAGPAENPAHYERHLGEMRGLDLLPALAEGLIANGREARERMQDVA